MTTSTSKIEPRHLRLQAVVYIRQSTPQQIQNNQESTRRQYDLACRARQMGWPETAVRVIDDDLGLSGASSRQRPGFQRLVAAIGLGEVGIVMVTEVSRQHGARIRGAGALTPTPSGVRRCGRSSGVRTPTCG